MGRLIALLVIICCQLAAQTSARPEVIVERGHGTEVTAVAISPDGRYALSSDASDSLILWDTSSGREMRRIEDCKCHDGNLAFSLDGKLALAAIWVLEGDYFVQGWSVPDLQPTRTWKSKGNTPQTVAVSPRDGDLVTSGYDRSKRAWVLTFWDFSSGRILRMVPTSQQTNRLMFTPDGKYLVAKGNGPASAIYEAATGRSVELAATPYAWLKNASFRKQTTAFSSDGKFFLQGDQDQKEIFEAPSPAPRAFKPTPGDCEIYSAAFAKTGQRLLAGCSNGGLRLYDMPSGALVRSFAGPTLEFHTITLSRDGSRAFTGGNWWDLTSGRLGGILPLGRKPNAYGISPDGRLGITLLNNVAVLWDLNKAVRVAALPPDNALRNSYFTFDGKRVLLLRGDQGALLWNLPASGAAAGRDAVRVISSVKAEEAVAVSPTENYAVSGTALVSLDTDSVIHTLVPRTSTSLRYEHKAFSADGATAMSASPRFIEVWNVATGQLLHEIANPYGLAEGISPDGKTIISYQLGSGFKIFSSATGKEIRRFAGPYLTWSIVFTPDGKRFLTSGDDRVVRLWDLATAHELLRMVAFTNGEWIAITPEGYYTASAKGDQYLTVRIGSRVYGIDQWRKTFYRPQVVDAILRMGDAGKAMSSVLGGQAAPITLASPELPEPPTLDVQGPAAGGSELALQVSDPKLPIESVSVYVNGRQMTNGGATRGAPKLDIPAGQKQFDLKVPLKLDPGENHVEVVASNGAVETRRGVVVNGPAQTSGAQTILPNLWILAIGINHYQASNLPSLSYAEADATAVAAEFAKQKGKLFRDVHTLLITDTSALKPTYENIVDNLNYLKKAGQNDIVLLFVAGHGLDDDSGDFYFLPSDAAFQDDGSVRRSRAVSNRELKSVLDLPARKIILLDACHAEGVTGRKTRSAESDTLVRELREARGVILSSSRGKELSQESPEWHHGAFTFALLEGMQGKADFMHTGEISMLALATYVSERVPILTKGAQHPITDTPEGYQQLEVVRLR